jgi:RimJ/RimL family protein N-acetyltransferase
MIAERLWTIQAREGDDLIEAIEPTPREIAQAAPWLAAHYNQPDNRRMMAHEADLSPEEVVACYHDMRRRRGRPFLLVRGRALLGDGDLRNIAGRAAEIALLIGDRAEQGRGLGTRFAAMLNAFAFQILDLDRVYASVIPGNAASRRLFARLGYLPDDSAAARAFAEDATDLTFSVDRAAFEAAARGALPGIRASQRPIDPPDHLE